MPDWEAIVRSRLGRLAEDPCAEASIVEEMARHLEERYDEAIRAGRSEQEALGRAEALLDGAGVMAATGAGRGARAGHTAPGVPARGGVLASVGHDVRFGLRLLLESPGFTATALLTLAIGIGANTAIFTVVNAVLLRPLPYPEAGCLVHFSWLFGGSGRAEKLSADKYLFWREHSRAFAAIAAQQGASFNLAGGIEPEPVHGMRVSDGYFDVLGVAPALGRSLLPEDDVPGGPDVAVVSDGLWRRGFAADEAIVGREIFLDTRPHTVVGVLPPSFRTAPPADVWTPLRLTHGAQGGGHNYAVVARLAEDVSLDQARADMAVVLDRFHEAHPGFEPERGVHLSGYHEWVVGDVRTNLLVLLAAVGMVLLIACANVANLLLARGAMRQKELAIRTALGADRGRIVRQLVTENVLLSIFGGAAGVALAMWALDALVVLSPGGLPGLHDIAVDHRVLAFTLAVSLLTGVVFGVLAWLRASRSDPNEWLKQGGRTSAAGRRRHGPAGLLVVSEVALSLVLLVGAALLIETFVHLQRVELGFAPDGLVAVQIPLTAERYGETAATWRFERALTERLASHPGVESVATASSLPLTRGLNAPMNVDGRGEDGFAVVEYRAVGPGYFRTLGVPVRSGRPFSGADAEAGPRVALINETLARRLFAGEAPLGRSISLLRGFGAEVQDLSREVVGVVGDIREFGPGSEPAPTVYVPRAQVPDGLTAMMNGFFPSALLIRAAAPAGLHETVREAVREVDPLQPIAGVRPMPELLGDAVTAQRFNMLLMVLFSAIALFLTAIGIYGVVSYQVSQRYHEIGVRLAVGARRADIVRLIVGGGMRPAAIGLAGGLAGAVVLTRFLEDMLFGVGARDPSTLVAGAAFIVVVVLVACLVPAWRATRIDPLAALREG